MKKIILGLMLLFSTTAYAGTVTLGTISADATAAGFNNNFTYLANVVNGNIEGSTDSGATVSNVKADSIFEINMANDANPRVRDAELFGIGVDSVSAGVLTQNAVVESGCVPATDTDLTSDISACVAYINGYRVSVGATSETYPASSDTYVDLGQNGSYTLSAVANGATQPAVAANSVRLAKVVTDGTQITTVTSLYTTRVPGLIIPANYRDGLIVSKDSTTTISILPGSAEINNTMVSKTSPTTLTISTAGDYAGGTSLRAASTYGFVGVDASGNLKLHTTAPTHDNYAVSQTGGKKRYATWSSTVYRILGWFYMDGAQLVETASNIKEGNVANIVLSSDLSTVSFTSTSYVTQSQLPFYSSGNPVMTIGIISGDSSAGGAIAAIETIHAMDGLDLSGSGKSDGEDNGTYHNSTNNTWVQFPPPSQATHTYRYNLKISSGTLTIRDRTYIVKEE